MPMANGSTWRELRSQGFVLQTDLDEDDARELLAIAEGMRSYLLGAVYTAGVAAQPTAMVVFAHESDARTLLARRAAGAFMPRLPNDLYPSPVFVTYGTLDDDRRETLTHELVHRLNFAAYGGLPPFLEEGLAEYYSTLRVSDEGVTRGLAPRRTRFTTGEHFRNDRDDGVGVLEIPLRELPSVRELFTLTQGDLHEVLSEGGVAQAMRATALYATSWAFVHFLMHGPPAYREAFRMALKEATGARVGATLEDRIESLGFERTDAALRAYLTQPIENRREAVTPVPAPPPVVRVLSPVETKLFALRILPLRGQGSAETAGYLQSLEEAATTPAERARVAYFRGRAAEANGDDLGAAHFYGAARAESRGDALLLTAWLLHASGGRLTPPGEPRACPAPSPFSEPAAAEEATLALREAARTALEHDMAARSLTALGRDKQALAHARQAVRLDPGCWSCLFTLSCLYAAHGHTDEARRLANSAQDRLPEPPPAEGAAALARHLATVRPPRGRPGLAAPRRPDGAPSGGASAPGGTEPSPRSPQPSSPSPSLR